MWVTRFLAVILFVTMSAMGFVHQKVEIIKTGYGIQKNRKYLSYLVDQNSRLMYNLSKLESPRHLLTSLEDQDIEFGRNRKRYSFSYQIAQADIPVVDAQDGIMGRVLDLLTPSAEARPRK